jgi:hypothetical protein
LPTSFKLWQDKSVQFETEYKTCQYFDLQFLTRQSPFKSGQNDHPKITSGGGASGSKNSRLKSNIQETISLTVSAYCELQVLRVA